MKCRINGAQDFIVRGLGFNQNAIDLRVSRAVEQRAIGKVNGSTITFKFVNKNNSGSGSATLQG